jgi:hypothetical protein
MGYKMLSGFDDSYRVFSNNVSAPWVTGTTATVDPNIMKWVKQTKDYTNKGYNNKTSLWDDKWQADQGPTGKVMGFFYSTWGINFTLVGNSLKHRPKRAAKKKWATAFMATMLSAKGHRATTGAALGCAPAKVLTTWAQLKTL